jgi:hypothetical protein
MVRGVVSTKIAFSSSFQLLAVSIRLLTAARLLLRPRPTAAGGVLIAECYFRMLASINPCG